MQIINSPDLSPAAGHYSHAVRAGSLLFISGQLPFAKGSREAPEGIAAQTRQALDNVEAILASAGATLQQLVNVQIYISDVAYWAEVNEIYARRLGDHRPARAIIPCGTLHHGVLVEIAAMAELA